MFKQTFLSIILLSSSLSYPIIYFPSGITPTNVAQAAATDIEFEWDIHNVIARKDNSAKLGAIFKHILPIGWSKITPNAAWNEINTLKKSIDMSGEGLHTIFLKHNEKKLAKMVLETANSYKPQKGIEQIVRAIHAKGITQRVASDIGPNFYAQLDSRFKNKFHCFVFDFIQPGKVVDYSQYGNNPIKDLPTHLTRYCKPDLKFFQDLDETYGKNKIKIFIDDKLENVQAAVKAGRIGIHFDLKNKKPMQHLQVDLRNLGITV